MDCTNAADTGASMHSMQASSSLSYFSYPLSLGQQALWVLYKTAPESVAYNLSGAVAVPGDTNLDALRWAFQKLAERHPMLRTTFASLAGPEGEPVQRVSPSAHVDFRCEDAVDLRPAQLDERLASEIYRPFDLERGPAWRVVVFEHAPVAGAADTADTGGSHPEHLVLLVFHHILGDLWSFALMTSEIASLYREAASGNPAALRPMRATYADYVTQEAERLAGPQAESSWDYWRTRLAGDLPSLDLPPDRPRLSTQTGRGAAEPITIDRDLTERLRRLAEHCHVAVHTVLLTAFQTLLHRYTGQDDLLVGVARAGRSHTFASVVGYFINPVVMRADFSGNPRVVDLLRANQHATEESAAHDWYPFPRLVQRLRPPREFGRSPLFQAMFSWQKTTALVPREKAGSFALGQGTSVADFGGLLMRPIATSHRVAPMDLTMEAAEGPDGLVAGIEYSTDLFDAATMARMAASYRILLEGITRDPEREVALLPIMPDAERQEIVEAWNATTAAAYPSELCLQQLVEQQAAQTPDVLAVVCGQQRLTYRELNQQANRLAHYLRQEEGVDPDTPVGLLCVRSAQALVGLLAILKAGGAYVPLDPGYPDERLAFMLHDSAVPLLLTQQGLGQRLLQLSAAQGDAQCGVRVISLDADGPDATRIHQQPTSNLPYVATPDQLAYLIYTSGSTGQPNGVALTHRGVVNLLSDMDRRQPLASGDACSWWTSLSFDVSVYEIFSAWLAGATLHVIPEEVRLDAPALLRWLAHHQIQSAYLPPFLLADYARWLQTHPGTAALRRLLVGVEPIPERVLLAICAQLPDLCLVNGYGPSETTICSTLYQVRATPSGTTAPAPAPAPPPAAHQRTPIGRPVANTQVYVLDQHQQPVPVGVVGEVYIGGVGLARGYWRRPELTAERFLPNPFSSAPGARLYRTGDLARWLPDGNLTFVGRRDSQVKLHGTRIELGEIEAVLAQHPQVKQAAVLLRNDPSGDRRLVAYVAPVGDPPPSPDELRRFLAQRLPHATLPAMVVVLDAFPLTPSGKVDRRTLPALTAPALLRSEQDRAFLEPRTEVERLLASIWEQALGIDRVGVNDNFFELGGDSILGIQIIARAAAAGLHLSPRHMFEAPTVAGLAALAQAQAEAATSLGIPTGIQAEQGLLEGEVPLSPVQRWFFERDFPDPQYWNQALLCMTRQPLNAAYLRAAVAALLEHHDALRLRYSRTVAGWSQTYAGHSEDIPCEVFDLSSLPEWQQTAAIEERAAALQHSLHLSAGPLMRVAYFDLGATRPGRLLIVIHHLAIDGVSWRILIEDLQTAYGQLQREEPIRLPPKTTSFRDWTQDLTDFAQSAAIRDEASFWLRAAGNGRPSVPSEPSEPSGPPGPSLPGDLHAAGRSLKPITTEGGAQRVSVRLSQEETQALLHDTPSAYGAQINDVLVTALALAFQRWTGSPALWIDLEGHGREDLFDHIDLTRTIGWFTAVYPVRLDLPPASDHRHAIQAISEQLRRIPRHGIGYGLLRYLCTDTALTERFTAIPPADVSFNYLGQIHPLTDDDVIVYPAPESSGPLRSPDAPRSHLLEIDAAIIQGELRSDWTYSTHVHHRATVERVASCLGDELRVLIAQGRSPASTGDTDSSVTVAKSSAAVGLHQDELNAVGTEEAEQAPTELGLDDDSADVYPLSPMQQGMLYQTLAAPASGTYVEQLTAEMQGALDVSAFGRAWRRTLERHTILRSSFVWGDLDRMLQRVHKEVELPLDLLDWRDLSAAEQRIHFHGLLAAERRRGFDLTRAPLMRLCVMRIADATHRVLLTYHHALLDGWSLALLFKEIFALYAAFTRNADLTLPPARPYRDYIAWLQTQDTGPAEVFWRNALAGGVATPALPLQPLQPLQRTPAAMPSSTTATTATTAFQPAEQELRLSTETTTALQTIARQQHVTLNTIVQGAWALLLSRYSQEDEVLFGATVADRSPDLPGVETMIGLFINTLPLRVVVDAEANLIEWLRRLQQQATDARQYAYSSLIQIQEWSGMPRGTPLFETILVFENYPLDAALHEDTGGIRLHDVRAIEQVNYPLAVVVVPGQQLQLKLVYDSKRFEPDGITRMLGHLCQLLERMAADPDQRLVSLSMLTASERRELVEAWNTTTAAYPSELCLQQLVEQQAAQTPDVLAVVCGQQRLTYRQLNQQANQLAHFLRHAGVGPDTPVGLLCTRSARALVGLLAILKAGGAYVPLDPSYPDERLAFMLHDSAAPLLLTQQGLGQRLRHLNDAQCGSRVIALDAEDAEDAEDSDAARIRQQPTSNPPHVVRPDQLAYLIYTSGSTGQPNGVALAHRGVVNLLSDMDRRQPLASGDACSWWTSLSFDVAVYEIFSAWLAGATLHVIPEEVRLDAPALLRWLAHHQIQSAYLPPFLLADYARWLQTHPGTAALRRLLVGVEPIPERVLLAICAQLPDLGLVNGYGPSETTICSTLYQVRATPSGTTAPAPASPPAAHQRTPIGRPVANTRVYVLDQHQQPVPVGVVGEVYIGGVGLARGYWRRPELTAERFLPNPFSSAPGARLYRTGDLARWLPDGNLVFVGRRDSQVKLRGTRIELGEIEAVLTQHPQVKQAVVLLRNDPSGDLSASRAHESLVAYCTPCGTAPRTSALRRFLSDRLPKPMIPAALVMLDAFPLTPSGKVDRQALPVVADAAHEPERPFAPAYSPLEQYLMQLWQDVLHREHVGLHDDFFELGGNSLLGAVLVHRLHVALHEDVALTAIFDLPTIAELATYLEERHAHGVARLVGAPLATPTARQATTEVAAIPSALVAIQSKGTRPPLFCIHPAGGVVFPYYTLAPYLGNDQPVYGIQDPCLYHTQSRFDCIEDMAAQYVEALQAVQQDGPYYLMGWSVGGLVAYEMAQQLERNGQQVAALILLDARAPVLRKRHASQSLLRNRVQRLAQLASVVQALPNSLPNGLKASGSVVKPILSYVHSGLFLLATSARRRRPASGKQPPAAMDLLRWAGLDTWRARLFTEAAVATTVSREASLQLIELPAVRRVLDLVRAHTRLARRYSAHTYSGRITLFRAVPAKQSKHQAEDPTLGWGNLAERGVEMHTIRANHVALFVKPYVEVLAQELKACLERSGSVATGAADEQPRLHA